MSLLQRSIVLDLLSTSSKQYWFSEQVAGDRGPCKYPSYCIEPD